MGIEVHLDIQKLLVELDMRSHDYFRKYQFNIILRYLNQKKNMELREKSKTQE